MAFRNEHFRNEFFPAYRAPYAKSRTLAELIRAAGVEMPKASTSSPSPLAELILQQSAAQLSPNDKAIKKNEGILATLGKKAGGASKTFLEDAFGALDLGRSAVAMGSRAIANEALMGIVNPILERLPVGGGPVRLYDINADKRIDEADSFGLARLVQGERANNSQLYWSGGTPGGGGLAGFRKNLGTLKTAGKTPSFFAGAGVYDTKKDDPTAEKVGKGALRFVADTVYDPLSYVTFGTGALGKAAATRAAEASGSRIVAGLGKDEVLNVVAKSERIFPKLVESGKVAADAGKDDVATAISDMAEDELRKFAADEIGGGAAAAYRKSQSTGLRKYLETVGGGLGKDRAWAADTFKSLPDEVRGGIRLSTPTGRTVGPRLTSGGSLMFEGRGRAGQLAGRAVEKAAELRTVAGGSKVASKLVLGADRPLVQAVKAAAAETVREIDGAGAKAVQGEITLATARAARDADRKLAHLMGVKVAEWAAQASAQRDRFKGSEETWNAVLRAAASHLDDANAVTPDGMVALHAIDGATPDMIDAAVTVARDQSRLLTDAYRKGRADYGEAFATAGDIEGPRRILTREGRAYLEDLKGVNLDEFNAEREAWRIVDENGEPIGSWTLAQINKQMAERHGVGEFFETDPLKLMEKGAGSIRRRAGRAAVQRAFEDAGLVVTGVAAERNARPEPVIASAKQLINKASRDEATLQRRLAGMAGPPGQGVLFDAPTFDEIATREALSDALARRKNLEKLIDDIAGASGDDQAQAVENLFSAVIEMRDTDIAKLMLQFGPDDDRVKGARAAVEALVKGSGGGTKSPIEGLTRLGTEAAGLGKGRSLLQNFGDKFASPTIAEALTRAYSLRNPTEASKFLQLHDEALTTWRRLATLGRGPQFTVRNVSGGIWNGWVAGARTRNWRQGKEYAQALRKAATDTQGAFESGKVTSADIGTMFEAILAESLAGKKIGGVPMYDLHVRMVENGTLPGVTASVIGEDLADFGPANFLTRNVSSVSQRDPETLGAFGQRAVRAADKVAGNNWYMRFMSNANETAETYLRASVFFAGIERYGVDSTGVRLADLLVKASQFDYSDLSPLERTWLSRLFPFFIWTKNNVPFQLRAIANQPGKVNVALRAYANTEAALSGDTSNDRFLPNYVKQNMGFTSSIRPGGVPLALGLNLPLSDVNRFLPSISQLEQGNVQGAVGTALGGGQDNVLGATNPFIKQLFEASTGTSTYTGNKYTDVEPGPVAGVLARVPFVGSSLLGAKRDPATGELQVSGYAQNALRNFLPPLAAAERLSPIGQSEAGQDRVFMNWYNATVGPALPITPQAAVNDQLIEAGQLREIRRLDAAAKRAAGNAGLDPKWIAERLDSGATPSQLRELIRQGSGRTGSYEAEAQQRWLVNAMRGGFTAKELAELYRRRSATK